jgi:hypothetical protein
MIVKKQLESLNLNFMFNNDTVTEKTHVNCKLGQPVTESSVPIIRVMHTTAVTQLLVHEKLCFPLTAGNDHPIWRWDAVVQPFEISLNPKNFCSQFVCLSERK